MIQIHPQTETVPPNQSAAPNAGIAPQLTIEHHCPGVGEPDRSAASRPRSVTASCQQRAGGHERGSKVPCGRPAAAMEGGDGGQFKPVVGAV
jgi:hypothetical protein